ncbi:MAG: hypothetical protein C5B49_15490 [Bdellovibrio sp.]|nr:MAG: hypothetical protein C5B49_15490 [Bdellovibrio sp.]
MDSSEVGDLVPTLGPPLYRFFLSRMPPQMADEAVQEVFVRMLRLDTFDEGKGSAEAFAWGIAINVCKEIRRQPQLLPIDDVDEPPAHPGEDRRFAALRAAVALMEEPELSVFQMVLADLSIATISEMLAMPEGTVKSHIHRGKEKLKRTLIKWGYQ